MTKDFCSKDQDLSSKDKDKDCIVNDKDKDCILVLKESLRTRTNNNITALGPRCQKGGDLRGMYPLLIRLWDLGERREPRPKMVLL